MNAFKHPSVEALKCTKTWTTTCSLEFVPCRLLATRILVVACTNSGLKILLQIKVLLQVGAWL